MNEDEKKILTEEAKLSRDERLALFLLFASPLTFIFHALYQDAGEEKGIKFDDMLPAMVVVAQIIFLFKVYKKNRENPTEQTKNVIFYSLLSLCITAFLVLFLLRYFHS